MSHDAKMALLSQCSTY